MKKFDTNFALLIELMEVSPKELTLELNVGASLISRWRTGGRRLMPNRRWAKALAGYFLEKNQMLAQALLREVYPVETARTANWEALLASWLCETDWKGAHAADRRAELLYLLPQRVARQGKDKTARESLLKATRTVSGDDTPLRMVLEFLTYALSLPEPGEILFACPGGLGIFTRDEDYSSRVLDKLTRVLRKGFCVRAALRTDFRISEVAAVSGPWLASQLATQPAENIRCFYYDDFRAAQGESILICLRGELAVQISARNGRIVCDVFRDPEKIAAVEARVESYLARSERRLHFDFFSHPDGFLGLPAHDAGKPTYLFQQLPDFGVGTDRLQARLGLNVGELRLLREQFSPLLLTPEDFDGEAPVCHLLCADAIDRALDQSKHLCHAVSAICGRRIYMSAQALADQLAEIKRLLEVCPNYTVCFARAESCRRTPMEIGVWGSESAIGWMRGGQSAACRDYMNVSALQGYCAMTWERISSLQRAKSAANGRLVVWLKRAKKFGLTVNPECLIV